MSQSGIPMLGALNSWPATPVTTPNTVNLYSSGPVESCISNAYNTSFRIPPRVKLAQFDGSKWSDWSGTFKAILTKYEAEDHLQYCTPPFDVDEGEWANTQQCLKAYLCLYMSSGVHSQISDKFTFPTLKDKWDQLKWLYSGATGCWDGHLHGKSWTGQSHTQGFGRTGLDITKGALNAPGWLQTIYGHREHFLAYELIGLICTYRSRTIWLCPYGQSMDYLLCMRPIIVWLDCFRVACLLTILTIP